MSEVDERRVIVGIEIDGPLERRGRVLRPPLIRQGRSEAAPSVGILRRQIRDPLEIRDGIVEIEL
ncbi:MAG TPA: hypothetical protein VFH48_21670 [Chloroflexota bacterium]|nr:hypothetical protein [Chloroflexota bacterium]